MSRKIAQYLAKGVAVVSVVDPRKETVTSHRPDGSSVTLRDENELLDLSDVIPGFRCSLREVFE
jgi:hypothetical protein